VIVVADTSVLIDLCRIGHGRLLKRLFQEVVIPPEVAAESVHLAVTVPRFAGLVLPDGIRRQSPAALSPVICAAKGLDAGEAAALPLAVEIHADAVPVDERRGYEVALQLGLHAIGVLGILLRAKAAGLLAEIKPVWMCTNAMPIFGFPRHCTNKSCGWQAKACDGRRTFSKHQIPIFMRSTLAQLELEA
jgi:predicted nucleic acid-binding protein